MAVVSTPDQEEKALSEYPQLKTVCLAMSEIMAEKLQENLARYRTSTPEERYRDLMEKRPDLLQRIPQYQIASYLGVQPESLSRIRKRISPSAREKIDFSSFLTWINYIILSSKYSLRNVIQWRKTMNRSLFRTVAGFFFILSSLCGFSLAAEERVRDDFPCQVETSAWMIANLMPDPGDFYQLSLGYRLDEKNILFLNGLTWKYPAPLGIPLYDPSFGSQDEEYPGYVRAFGVGVGYQRFIWKGLFASLYATPFLQKFLYKRQSVYAIRVPAVPAGAAWIPGKPFQRPLLSEARTLRQLLACQYEFPGYIPTEGKELAQLYSLRAPSEHRLQVLENRIQAPCRGERTLT